MLVKANIKGFQIFHTDGDYAACHPLPLRTFTLIASAHP